MLKKRVQEIVELYWAGNVKAAAIQLGIPQNTLYRIASGETPNPRADALLKIADFAGASVEYLLTGAGRGPQTFTARGRRISGESLRWWRLVDQLYPKMSRVRELLDSLPFGPQGFIAICHPQSKSSGRPVPSDKLLRTSKRVQDTVTAAWVELLEDAIAVLGAETVRKRLDPMEIAVAGGLTEFARFLASGGMTSAQAEKHLAAWELTWNPGDPPDE